jgi:inhibitor of KinA sporulation pathway (predicted exonuclease)
VKNLHPEITMNRTGTHHNALDDARNQAQHLIDIFKQKYN